ncbi:17b521a2-a0ea-422a-b777-40f82330a15a [Sclerotinia trifoliorum]|uniref:17b521a2-a0ea-422a-b777-40f82330a15a n=1 Tax=Sclerotinia trifoliorum TaxID=28548 RepID=A0A8H2W5U3_9HELO|nr:17b521a2-a0ea-422a-b777-40f82330a15a [Sclerotinia trifoliorum]
MAEENNQPPQVSQQKYSRYRSVRALPSNTDLNTPNQDVQQNQSTSLSRTKSMSRYRRPKLAPKSEDSPSVPTVPESHGPPTSPNSTARVLTTRRTSDPVDSATGLPSNYAHTRRPIPKRSQTHLGATGESQDYNERQESYELNYSSDNGIDQHKILSPSHSPPPVSLPVQLSDEETEKILAEQKRKDLARLEATLDAAANDSVKSPPQKFGFFSSKRRATTTTTNPIPAAPLLSNVASIQRAIADGPPRIEAPVINPVGIQQGGGGVVPQTDAPISASNASERRVLIRCKQSSINLPVDGDTTPIDIINSAANIMSADIDPRTAVLLESYTTLGVERKIRRYEHIRDIMNSWDRDTQNALIVEASDFSGCSEDLEASSVPNDAPQDVTVQLYHSQKPGKWNKRYITLLSSGQIFVSKKSGMGPNDKDSMSICHLSDFDIYTPTAQQIRKTLKPPRKNCYAIKSQQKTAMFLSTENFVHFFCTDDQIAANAWYSAVQKWRSWYLVKKKGEGQKKATKTVKAMKARIAPKSGTGIKGAQTHRINVSVDEDPYMIGSFKPLLDMDRFDRSEADDSTTEDEKPKQVPFHLRNTSIVAPLPRPAKNGPPVAYRAPTQEDEFASGGLLGRTYSVRQKAQQEREDSLKNGSFTDGSILINGNAQSRSLSMPAKSKRPETANAANTGLQRSPSSRKPKPLLDFTPQFEEAPQWNKKGKGHGVTAPTGLLLVEAANTPDTGLIEIPKANMVFRRDTTSQRPRTSVNGRDRDHSGSRDPFVRGGLVSGNGSGGGRSAGSGSLTNSGKDRGRMGYE